MALTVPSLEALYNFWGPESPVLAESAGVDDYNTSMLNLAADLVWLATGLDADPSDPRQLRFVQYAIEDMAIYLSASRENVTENYSPFTSEHIGSYSYSKTLARDALTGNTGVQFFDILVNAINQGAWADPLWAINSEAVFTAQQRAYDPSERLLHRPVVASGGGLHDPTDDEPYGNVSNGGFFATGAL